MYIYTIKQVNGKKMMYGGCEFTQLNKWGKLQKFYCKINKRGKKKQMYGGCTGENVAVFAGKNFFCSDFFFGISFHGFFHAVWISLFFKCVLVQFKCGLAQSFHDFFHAVWISLFQALVCSGLVQVCGGLVFSRLFPCKKEGALR